MAMVRLVHCSVEILRSLSPCRNCARAGNQGQALARLCLCLSLIIRHLHCVEVLSRSYKSRESKDSKVRSWKYHPVLTTHTDLSYHFRIPVYVSPRAETINVSFYEECQKVSAEHTGHNVLKNSLSKSNLAAKKKSAVKNSKKKRSRNDIDSPGSASQWWRQL